MALSDPSAAVGTNCAWPFARGQRRSLLLIVAAGWPASCRPRDAWRRHGSGYDIGRRPTWMKSWAQDQRPSRFASRHLASDVAGFRWWGAGPTGPQPAAAGADHDARELPCADPSRRPALGAPCADAAAGPSATGACLPASARSPRVAKCCLWPRPRSRLVPTTGRLSPVVPLRGLRPTVSGAGAGSSSFLAIFVGFLCQPVARRMKNASALALGFALGAGGLPDPASGRSSEQTRACPDRNGRVQRGKLWALPYSRRYPEVWKPRAGGMGTGHGGPVRSMRMWGSRFPSSEAGARGLVRFGLWLAAFGRRAFVANGTDAGGLGVERQSRSG